MAENIFVVFKKLLPCKHVPIEKTILERTAEFGNIILVPSFQILVRKMLTQRAQIGRIEKTEQVSVQYQHIFKFCRGLCRSASRRLRS
jgi:hypothetical protein